MLAEQGAQVAINYVSNAAAAEEVLAMIGGRGMIVQGDQSDETAVNKMTADVTATLGPVDLLVCNAGIGQHFCHMFWSFSIENVEFVP